MTALLEISPLASWRARTLGHLADRPLTQIELLVMDLVADGRATKEIANMLGLSPLTVKQHLVRVSIRFGTGDRAGMVGGSYRAGALRRRPPGPDVVAPRVTERQHGVLVLVARGLSNAEIGARLGISRDTVKSHLAKLFEAFSARNRAHLVRLTVDAGVLRIVPAGSGAAS